MNRQLGYRSPADLVDLYPQFYWNSISGQIQTAIRYLSVTESGRQWIANLYSNVYRAERAIGQALPSAVPSLQLNKSVSGNPDTPRVANADKN